MGKMKKEEKNKEKYIFSSSPILMTYIANAMDTNVIIVYE